MTELLQEQFVVVLIGGNRYGLNIREMNEIIRMQEITPVVSGRPYLEGVINLRGKIVPVVHLRKRFGKPIQELRATARIVVVAHAGEWIGMIVDAVERVTRFTQMADPPVLSGAGNETFLSGVGYTPEGLVSVFNVDALLEGEGSHAG